MTDIRFKKFLDGDPDDVWSIYHVYRGPLITYGQKCLKTHDYDVAVDIALDALWLLRDHSELKTELDIKKWLYVTVRNKCWNANRELHHHISFEEETGPASEFDVTQTLDYKESEAIALRIKQLILEELERLPTKRSRDFLALRFEKKTIEEIAEERGVSKATVIDNVAHAQKAIRKYLKSKGLNF